MNISDLSSPNYTVKVGTISLHKKNYPDPEDFFKDVGKQIILLLKNHFLVSAYNDELAGTIMIQFSPAEAGTTLQALPVWMSMDQYVEFISDSLLKEDNADNSDNLPFVIDGKKEA